MNNTRSPLEKIDAAANLVAQMYLAHTIRDEATFLNAHKKASDLLFRAMRQLEFHGEGDKDTVESE